MMKKLAFICCLAAALSGCAHKTANPVQLAQTGDDTKSCQDIVSEIREMRAAAKTAEAARKKQVKTNVMLGVSGVFLVVPWFFMDTGNAATVEKRAAIARQKRLKQMAIKRHCDVGVTGKAPVVGQ